MGRALAGSCVCANMVEESVRVVRCGGSRLNFRRALFSADSKYVGADGAPGSSGRGGDCQARQRASLDSACPDPELPGHPGLVAAWVSLGSRTPPPCGRSRVRGQVAWPNEARSARLENAPGCVLFRPDECSFSSYGTFWIAIVT